MVASAADNEMAAWRFLPNGAPDSVHSDRSFADRPAHERVSTARRVRAYGGVICTLIEPVLWLTGSIFTV